MTCLGHSEVVCQIKVQLVHHGLKRGKQLDIDSPAVHDHKYTSKQNIDSSIMLVDKRARVTTSAEVLVILTEYPRRVEIVLRSKWAFQAASYAISV